MSSIGNTQELQIMQETPVGIGVLGNLSFGSDSAWMSSPCEKANDTRHITYEESDPLLDLLDFFHLYYIPLIIFVGLFGNVLSCIVFLNTHLRMRSSSYYLAALASADFGFLATLFMVWLNNVGVPLFNKNGWCQVLVYTSSVCSSLSVWLIVAFTVERFIAVQYPLQRPHMCTVSRAKTIVICLTGFALLTHSYSFVTAGMVREVYEETGSCEELCGLLKEYHELMRIINTLDSILTLIAPLVLIVIMNTMITRNLLRFSRKFKSKTSRERVEQNMNQALTTSSRRRYSQQSFHSSKSNSSQMRNNPSETPPRCIYVRSSSTSLVSTRTQHNITKMLLLISTVFILLNLPSYVIRLYIFIFSLSGRDPPPSVWYMQQYFMLLYYTNFSINFLLYSTCGATFRRCLWQLTKKKLKSLSRSHCKAQSYM